MRWVYISNGMREEITFSSSAVVFSLPLLSISLNLQIADEHDSRSSRFYITSSELLSEPSKFKLIIMAEEHHEVNPGEEGLVPVLKWDLGLFEQIVRSFRFPPEWDARYPGQNQTAADAPSGYITLFEDFFHQGNFRLPATNFMAHILQFYGFHISQMSPPGMVRVRHFEFLCRSHGIEPTVERFRVFYQLIRNMGFYSFASRGGAKKILLNPPKSFHDWKPKFFYIHEEVIPVAMTFRAWSEPIVKEDLPIPKQENWYVQLTSTPNRVFGENVLVAAGMSDQWVAGSTDVLVLKFDDREAHLYQVAFPTFSRSMGVRPLRAGEEYWYDQIKGHFMYPVADAFADPPTTTEGAHIPNPRPLRVLTSAGKEIVYLSSEESVGSSNGELSSWSTIFAGVLRDLGIDPEEKKKKPKKKVITIDADVPSRKGGSSRATAGVADKGTFRLRQSNLEDYVIISDSFEGLSRIGEKKAGAAGSKSSGSAGSRNPDVEATPSSVAHEEEEKEEEVEEEEPAVKLIRKRSREATVGASVMSKPGGVPLIGKKSNLRSLYRFSPEGKKKTPEKKGVVIIEPSEPALKRPKVTKVTIKPFKVTESEKEKHKAGEKPVKEKDMERKRAVDKPLTEPKEPEVTAATLPEKAQGPEVVHVTGLDQPIDERRKEPEVEKPVKPLSADAPVQTTQVTSAGGSGSAVDKEKLVAARGASSGGPGGFVPQSPIGPKDTIGDLYYKTYTEELHDNAPHQAPWGLKQKDMFKDFSACCE
ncbi:hypothetical protein HanHA300_Chr09g0327611 [Helianthus annuus]|nr:hypothetical protein HanHA300_Chr09g0327611 [Helianthus annuus]KAJ0543234.1 hypothetical protein HanHA89_Chr09g0348531 [Helianthus annuus]KAJ0708291.1 hypothetical protein HanLR1_Chr09g0327871 [Helianthus annuus]